MHLYWISCCFWHVLLGIVPSRLCDVQNKISKQSARLLFLPKWKVLSWHHFPAFFSLPFLLWVWTAYYHPNAPPCPRRPNSAINPRAVGCSCTGTASWCPTLHRAKPNWSWRRATSCSCTRSARTAGSKARSRGTAERASFPAASSTASDSNTCLLSGKNDAKLFRG